MNHICISKLTIIGSDIALSSGQRHDIIWTNGGILLIEPLDTNFSEIFIEIKTFSLMNLSKPQCVSHFLHIQHYPSFVHKVIFTLNGSSHLRKQIFILIKLVINIYTFHLMIGWPSMPVTHHTDLFIISHKQVGGRSWIYLQHINLRAVHRFTCCP